jgi:MFS family permease
MTGELDEAEPLERVVELRDDAASGEIDDRDHQPSIAPTQGRAPDVDRLDWSQGGRVEVDERDSGRGWLVAVAIAVSGALSFGTAYTFGTFFDAMADEFDAGRGSTALVFAITLLLFFGTGIASGPLGDRVGPRPLVAVGGVLLVGGLLATSQVEELWLGYFTYGIGVGLGCGLFVTPLYATAGRWFVRRRALALGVVSAGNGLGTLTLVPLAERVISGEGWRTAYVTLAVIDGILLLFVLSVVRAPRIVAADEEERAPEPGFAERFAELRGEPAFRTMFWTTLLTSISLFTAFAFVVPFAEDEGVTSSRAALLVGIIGASSVLGRLAIGGLAGWFGSVRLLQGSLMVQPLAYVTWLVAGDRYALLVVFAVLLGISYGGFVSLGPEVTVHLLGVIGLGTTFGLVFLATGLGGLVGPPLVGVLSDLSDGRGLPIGAVIGVTVLALGTSLRLPTAAHRPVPAPS